MPSWKKNCGCQMLTHPSIAQANSCLTSLLWPLTLTALSVYSCLYCASLKHLTEGLLSLCEKKDAPLCHVLLNCWYPSDLVVIKLNCCLQGQLYGLCLWFWPKRKMRMILRIKITLQKWCCKNDASKMTLQKLLARRQVITWQTALLLRITL